jgi:hypothetical protein
MGKTPEDKVARWCKAAGQEGKGKDVVNRVIIAGEFLERTARMSEADASDCLSGIDFSKTVSVVRLPPSVYVQYVQKHKGVWFTDTGLTPDAVGLADGKRKRKLFKPRGSVYALKSTARAIKDTWTAGRLFQSMSPRGQRAMGQMTRGGGAQYIVFDKSAMEEI